MAGGAGKRALAALAARPTTTATPTTHHKTPVRAETKFDSGCGWPAFYAEVPGAVDRTPDNSFGAQRVEITCSNCGGHLGWVV